MTQPKRHRKWLLVGLTILLPAIVAFIGLHFFLVNHFTTAIQKLIVPEARQRLGVDVAVGNATVNLLAGTLNVSDIRIGNPAGFQEPASFSLDAMKLDVGLSGLISRIATVSEARIDNANAFLIRGRNGDINLLLMRDTWESRQPKHDGKSEPPASHPQPKSQPLPKPSTPHESKPPRQSVPLPRLLVDKSAVSTSLAYVDYGLSENVFRLTLKLNAEARGLSTYELPGGQWGTLKVDGHLAEDPKSFIINLLGRVAPISDPQHPSFDLTGDVADIDLSRMEAAAQQLGISSQSVSLNVNVQCRDGIFDEKTSRVIVRFKKARPVGKLARKLRNMPIRTDLSVVVPVGGTFRKIEFHWEDALLQSALENASSILDSIPEENKLLDKETTRLLKDLGGLLKK